jgi:hypothetical protein
MTVRGRAPIEERFWRNVNKSDGCWLYGIGAFSGYRSLALGAKSAGTIGVHKYSYELHHGPVPDGMVVMHKCDNPRCVNPDHLEVGSYEDNTQDMYGKGRAKPAIVQGRNNGKSKLTEADVRYIRANPERGHKDLADELGVSPNAVRGVRIGRTWNHIT